jgi:arabinose-5-phosphate isomerase
MRRRLREFQKLKQFRIRNIRPLSHGWNISGVSDVVIRTRLIMNDKPKLSARRKNELSSADFARQILLTEANALRTFAESMDDSVCCAARLIVGCRGNVVVTGIGKAGHIGQKISATLSSTGTPSHFLHPAEAVHGDLGRLRSGDLIIALSKSGETQELNQLIGPLAKIPLPIIAVTSSANSTLGRAAKIVIGLGAVEEACPLRLAPTTSTTLMLAVGDALALLASRARQFDSDDFGRHHPAGMLGWQLSPVEQHMRPISNCRMAPDDKSIRQVFVELSRPGRRTGAILLIDAKGKLSGLFTDSDLARLFEHESAEQFDRPIHQVMTKSPLKVVAGTKMSQAVTLISSRRISELPVVDKQGRPVGLLDITDLIGVTAETATETVDVKKRKAAA